MGSIRHYLVFLGCLTLLAFPSGARAALWTGLVVIIAIVLHRSASIVSESKHAVTLIIVAYAFSVLSLGIGATFLFRRFGWLPAIAAPVVSLIYLVAKEDESQKWERAIGTAKAAIFTEIAKSRSGAITRIQLGERSQAILGRLPRQAYYISSVRKPLLADSSSSPEDYNTYLELLERHVARADVPPHDLLHEVRARLKR